MDRKKLRERLARATPYLLALVTAVLLRIFLDNLNDTERKIEVPLTTRNIPADGRVIGGLPSSVSVKLTGYKSVLDEPGLESKLVAWVDLGRLTTGTNILAVRTGGSRLPFELNFASVTPSKIKVFVSAPTNAAGAETP